jgi:hypothetical protein
MQSFRKLVGRSRAHGLHATLIIANGVRRDVDEGLPSFRYAFGQICATIMMQLLPFVDPQAVDLLRDFERAVYTVV